MNQDAINNIFFDPLERRARHAAGDRCPGCGNSDTIESNGERGAHLAFVCTAADCGETWVAIDYQE
jgi:Zn ribbon nucleic-acid-binding protein